MSTSESSSPVRRVTNILGWLATAAVVITAVVHCGAPEQCLRYSDCTPGWTCSAGACVPQGGDNVALSSSSTVEASTGTDSSRPEASTPPVADAGVDAMVEAAPDAGTGTEDAAVDDTSDF